MLKEDNREACGYELINLGSSEVFAIAHHFVQCYDGRERRKPVPLLGLIFQHETLCGLLSSHAEDACACLASLCYDSAARGTPCCSAQKHRPP